MGLQVIVGSLVVCMDDGEGSGSRRKELEVAILEKNIIRRLEKPCVRIHLTLI